MESRIKHQYVNRKQISKFYTNSYLLKYDVNTMLAIPNVTEWKSSVITFSAVPSWLATTIFKNNREVEEPKHSKTDC